MDNTTKQLKKIKDNNPFVLLIAIIVFFISSFFTISQGISWLINTYQNTFNWRSELYEKITNVRAGMNIQKFNEAYGAPLFINTSNNYFEYIYKGKDFWIQAIATISGQVDFYSVTSCDNNFDPTILPNAINKKITLQKTTFSEIGNDSQAHYYLREATANSFHFESYYYGNPSNYQTVVIGINDACLTRDYKYPSNRYNGQKIDYNDEDVKIFRDTSPINTYGETSIQGNLDDVIKNFQFGVNRIQIRPYFK